MHRIHLPRRRCLRLVVLLTVGLAACAGEDALSAEEYRSEANRICRSGNERVEELTEELGEKLSTGETPSAADLREAVSPVLEEIQGQLDDIRELDGPADLEGEVHDALDEADSVVEEVESQLEEDPVELLQSEDDPFAEVNRRLNALDLEECGAA